MGNTGAGPRWLVEARHESAFRHWQTAATAAPVRHKGHARGEAEVFGYDGLSSMQKKTLKGSKSGSKFIHEQFPL